MTESLTSSSTVTPRQQSSGLQRVRIFLVRLVVFAIASAVVDWVGAQLGAWHLDRQIKHLWYGATLSALLTFAMPHSERIYVRLFEGGDG